MVVSCIPYGYACSYLLRQYLWFCNICDCAMGWFFIYSAYYSMPYLTKAYCTNLKGYMHKLITLHYSNLILFTDSKHELHSIDSLSNLQIQSKRPVKTSLSLHTQTGLHCLAIQVLNTRVWFLDLWYTSLTSVHNNLEHGLKIVTESFSPLDLDCTSLVKVQIRSDMAKLHSSW